MPPANNWRSTMILRTRVVGWKRTTPIRISRAALPADGTYYIHLSDTQGQGGPEFAYRLRVSEPRPDFALRIAPSSLSVRAGMSVPVTVYALRKDGFTNAIDLALKDAPAGLFVERRPRAGEPGHGAVHLESAAAQRGRKHSPSPWRAAPSSPGKPSFMRPCRRKT